MHIKNKNCNANKLSFVWRKYLYFVFILLQFTQCRKPEIQLTAVIEKENVAAAETQATDLVNAADFGAAGINTDDTQALQDAINSQKRIYIPKGTYIISKPLTKTGGKLVIIADSAVIKLSPSFPKSPAYTGALVLKDLLFLQIQGLTIDGNRSNLLNAGPDWRNYIMGITVQNSDLILLNHCIVNNGPSISFSLRGSSNAKIINCSSSNSMYHGVELYQCTNTVIDKFNYKGIGNQGINASIGGIGVLATLSDNIQVIHCNIEDSPDTGTKTEGCNYVTWDGNTVKNSGKDGIKFQNMPPRGSDPGVQTVFHGSIINNTVDKIFNGRSDGSSLIQVWNAQDVVVSNNTITGGTKTGYEAGVEVWASGGVTKNVVVANNTILNTNQFIYISYVSDVQINGNICENKIAPVSSGVDGFKAEVSHNFSVTNNQFKRHDTTAASGSGVYIYNCADFSFTKNTITNAHNGIDASFTESRTVNISNNTWSNFGRYFASIGVNSAQTVDSILMNDNTISKIGAGPLLFKINGNNLSATYFNIRNTKVIGNGSNRRWALEISSGGNIAKTDLTNFSSSGYAVYPHVTELRSSKKIIGWRSNAPPKAGTWSLGDVVFNMNPSTGIAGWVCIGAGHPGAWKTIP